MKNQWKSSKIMIFHDFFDEMKKYVLNFSLVEKKNEKFSTSSKTKNKQYTIYEVLRLKFLLGSGQPNMICSRDSQYWFWIENVSKHVML